MTKNILTKQIPKISKMDHKIMPTREVQLQFAYNGLLKTNIPLVAIRKYQKDNEEKRRFEVAAYSDDEGIYLVLPVVAIKSNISLEIIKIVFFNFVVFISFIISVLGFYLIIKNWIVKLFIFIALGTFSLFVVLVKDLYIFYFFGASFIPIVFFFLKTNYDKINRFIFLLIFCIIIGNIIYFSNLCRSHSATGLLIFFITTVALIDNKSLNIPKRLITIAVLCISMVPLKVYINNLENCRDAFLDKHIQNYTKRKIVHPFWHSVYIGLGYLKHNKYNIYYGDKCAIDKVFSVNPSTQYLSKKYETILKNEYITILKNDLVFILKVYTKKVVEIFKQGFSHIFYGKINLLGLLLLFYLKLPIREIIPFVITILFGTLFGILVMPTIPYLLGYISTLYIFAIYIISVSYEKYIREFAGSKS